MAKTAFLCPGQGAQRVRMGTDFMTQSSLGPDFVEDAKEACGLDLYDMCLNGPAENLARVENGYPCMAMASILVGRALMERGIVPDCVAGLFQGELAAHGLAGTLDDETLMMLIGRSGAVLAMAGSRAEGAMALLLDCDAETAQSLCQQADGTVVIAAMLGIDRPLISGAADAVAQVRSQWEGQGQRSLDWFSSAALHSPLMEQARMMMTPAWRGTLLGVGEFPVYCGYDASTWVPTSIEVLANALDAPFDWAGVVNAMLSDGVDTFYICGQDELLADSVKSFAAAAGKDVAVIMIASPRDLER